MATSSFVDNDTVSENSYLRHFERVLDFMFTNTELGAKDGESVCSSTRRMQIINNEEVSFGWRLDLIIINKHNKMSEICSLKFKKHDASFSTLTNQQSKNMRTNACILNEIHLLSNDDTISVTYMDFAGTHGYIAQLIKFEGRFISHEVGKFSLIESLLELEDLRKSIINLYRWKADLVNKSNIIRLANAKQENKYALCHISCPLVRSPPRSPNPTIVPARILLSPSKSGKRTREVFGDED
ncbi:hypothetical protein EDC94DRAFT_668010 [Helicostylum pulchrum]|nr:hypothetical protein EDC94DRAFT_668010 [Helicostylum pulchrum]